MSVRRLAAEQPESFAFTPENSAWARQQLLKFPEGKQASTVIPLLWRVQTQEGWVSEPAIRYVAEFLDMPYIRVLEVATFYTMFQLAPVGKKAHIQVCGTTPCMLRGAGELLDVCRHRIHHDPFHISADGNLSWEEVECLGACVNAPMLQIAPDNYEDLTPETLNQLIDDILADKPLTPGPQKVDRKDSAPLGGQRVLVDAALYDGSVIGTGAGLAAAREAIAAREAAAAAPPADAPPAAPVAAPSPPPVAPPPAAQPVKTPESGPAAAPATPAVKAQAEADRTKVPDAGDKPKEAASDPSVRPDGGKKE